MLLYKNPFQAWETLENMTNIVVFLSASFWSISRFCDLFRCHNTWKMVCMFLQEKQALTQTECADVTVMMCPQSYCSTMSPSAGLVKISRQEISVPFSLGRMKCLNELVKYWCWISYWLFVVVYPFVFLSLIVLFRIIRINHFDQWCCVTLWAKKFSTFLKHSYYFVSYTPKHCLNLWTYDVFSVLDQVSWEKFRQVDDDVKSCLRFQINISGHVSSKKSLKAVQVCLVLHPQDFIFSYFLELKLLLL